MLGVIKVSEDKEALAELIQDNEAFQHLDREAVMVINACTKMNLQLEKDEEEGTVNMCKAIEDMKADSRKEGRDSLLKEKVKKKLIKGKSMEQIAEELEEEVDTIIEICKQL